MAIASLIAAVLAGQAVGLPARPRFGMMWTVAAIAAGAVGALGVRWRDKRSPGGVTAEGVHLEERWIGRERGRASCRTSLPESVAVKLALELPFPGAPGLGLRRRRQIRLTLNDLYSRIGEARDRERLGCCLGPAIRDLVGLPFDRGHYLACVPERPSGGRPSLLIFMHGNGGNAWLLPWAWHELARDRGLVVVSPTAGAGFWDADAVGIIRRVRREAINRYGVDPQRVFLGGISDGGLGVTRAAAAEPGAYRGLLYVSPTLRIEELAAPAFASGWAGRPALVVQGGRDVNVTPASVELGVATLRASGVDVIDDFHPDDDHFLFFDRREAILERVGLWMDGVEGPGVTPAGAG